MSCSVADRWSELKAVNRFLRLLVENEILRLSVWDNPTNDAKRRSDPPALLEKGMVEVNLLLF